MVFRLKNTLFMVNKSSDFLLQHIRRASFVGRIKYEQKLIHDDTECVQAMENGHFLYYFKNKVLVKMAKPFLASPIWIPYGATHHAFSKIKKRLDLMNNAVFLNATQEKLENARFALQLHPLEQEHVFLLEELFKAKFEELRMLLPFLQAEDLSVLTKARSLLHWNSSTNFCSNCGLKLTRNHAGSQRICNSCRTVFYPSVSPCVIVLVHTKDKCLLVRQHAYLKGMFTAIGGFIEPGETPEDGLRREVAEEVGLEVEEVKYLCSQHWPFPISSLMFGFHATVASTSELCLDSHELEDAQWFDVQTVKEALQYVKDNPRVLLTNQTSRLLVPPPGPIAHFLLQEWVKSYASS